MNVGITDKLSKELEHHIQFTALKRLEVETGGAVETSVNPHYYGGPLVTCHPALSTPDPAEIESVFWAGTKQGLIDMVPPAWINETAFGRECSSISFEIFKGKPAKEFLFHLTGDGQGKFVRVPKRHSHRVDLTWVSPSQYPPALAALIESDKIIEKARKQAETKAEEITEFLKKFKTLNQAVKAFPELRQILPEAVKDRLDAKPERSDAVKREAQNNLPDIGDVLTNSAVTRLCNS
jgi:hypothetical protein